MKLSDAFSEPRHHFGVVLALIVIALTFLMAAPDTSWARLVTVTLQGSILLASLAVGGARDWVLRLSGGLVVLVVVLVGLIVLGFSIGGGLPRLVSLLLVLLAPVAVVLGIRRGVIEDQRVTMQTVYGGLCLYLLSGLAYALLFNFIQDVDGAAFFSDGVRGTSNDFVYFSLVTLSTTGYGDFTAASEFGRTVAVTEAVAGQVYLVTVVALLVSNVGASQPRGPGLRRWTQQGQQGQEGQEAGSGGSSPAQRGS